MKDYNKVPDDELQSFWHTTHIVQITNSTTIKKTLKELGESLIEHVENREQRGSGWVFVRFKNFEIHIARFKPLKGSSWFDLPDFLNRHRRRDTKSLCHNQFPNMLRHGLQIIQLKTKPFRPGLRHYQSTILERHTQSRCRRQVLFVRQPMFHPAPCEHASVLTFFCRKLPHKLSLHLRISTCAPHRQP